MIRHSLSTDDELILFGPRIGIPVAERTAVRRKLHSAHQGLDRVKRRARQTVYWLGITIEITMEWENCRPCQERAASLQRKPLASDPPPTRVFENVHPTFLATPITISRSISTAYQDGLRLMCARKSNIERHHPCLQEELGPTTQTTR